MRKTFATLVALLALLLSSCASTQALQCRQGEKQIANESLYFGTDKPNGKVSETDWRTFLNEVVTPRFPNGLSVWQASGQWKSDAGPIVREDSYVLNIVHSGQAAELAALDEIASAYKSRHAQEAVLRVRSQVCVAF